MVLVLALQTAVADPVGLPTEEDFLSDMPVVLSATRLAQPKSEAPAAITVIDREMIEASGATEIPELFRLVPGFQVGHDTEDLITVDPTAVTYHGLSDAYARRMQVLIDGRSVYSPDFGGVRWSDLPLVIDDIERIEIIRGPNAVTYGANSFLAVINIITQHPTDVRGTFTKIEMGNDNSARTIVRHGGSSGKLDYRITVAYEKNDGFTGQYDSENFSLAAFRGEYRPGPKDTIDFQFGFSGGPHQAGTDPAQPTDDIYRTAQRNTSFQQIRWMRRPGADEEYSLNFYHNYHNYDDTYIASIFALNDATIITDVLTERYDLEFQHILSPFPDWRFVWGAEVRLDQVTGAGWFYGMGTVSNRLYRLFGNAEWRIAPKWIANGGAMLEYNDFTGAGVSPRLAVNYHATTHSTWRAVASSGLRTPAIIEESANSIIETTSGPVLFYYGDGNLRPEKITSYELGYLGEYRDQNLVVDLKVFQDDIKDVISYSQDVTTGTYYFVNGGSAVVRGAEMELHYKPTKQLRMIVSHAYTEQTGIIQTEYSPPVYASSDLTTPRNTTGFLGIYRFSGNWSTSLAYYRVSKMQFIGGDQTGDYDKLDLRLARKVRDNSFNGTIEFVAQNLLGPYSDFRQAATFDKRIYFRLSLQAR